MAHVMLVDEDKNLIAANSAALGSHGFKVTAAHSCAEGRKLLFSGPAPDLLVLDVLEADKKADFEFLSEICVKHPSLPVVLLTGLYAAMDESWKAAFDADKSCLPVHRFLEKPVSPAILLHEIELVLEEAGHTASSH
jgi:DNA-binding NtrC family response regulator